MIMLENEKLLVALGTGRGARIEKFVDKENGKDWVWRPKDYNEEKGNQILGLEASFDENWAGGWEEVFPNDAPSEIKEFKLVDHGEVWRRSWTLEERTKSECTFSINCESYPVFMRKSYMLDSVEARLTVEYEIHSRSPETLPFIFKFHPALAIEAEDVFILPQAQGDFVAPGFGQGNLGINKVLREDGKTREFMKYAHLSEGECALQNQRTGKELMFRFPKKSLPYLWLFQSYGGFMNHYVAMLEPTNAGHYDLKEAFRDQKCGVLRPYEEMNFSLEIFLE